MKAAGEAAAERAAVQHRPQLRALADVSRRHATPATGLGYLAPPRDPRQAQARRLRDYVIWGSLVVILGCAVMLGVWFLAGR